MTADQFIKWRTARGLSQQAAGDLLGLTERQVRRYEQGDTAIPRAIALACRALDAGLTEGENDG